MRAMGCLGLFVLANSAFFVVAALANLIAGDSETEPGVILGLLVFFALTGYGGYWLYRSSGKKPPNPNPPEQRILALAEKNQGRITLAEVVLYCDLKTEEAREQLKSMVRQGLAELHVSEGGEEVYAFGGLMPEEKHSATDPLED